MADFEQKLKYIFIAIVFAMAAFGVTSGAFVAPAGATAIGDSKAALPDKKEERHEPSANEPGSPLPADREKNGAASVFENFPASAIRGLSDQNNEYIDEENAIPAILASITDIAQIPDFADALTALEWVRRWADTGYWLEIDQWADFKAVAIASYSPEIQYWLGRDSWASFSSTGKGDGSRGAVVDAPTLQYRAAIQDSDLANTTNVMDSTGKPANKYTATIDRSATRSIRKLAVSMIKKIAHEPIFYAILACGFGLLFWALRKQKRA